MSEHGLSLAEAVARFLATLSPEQRQECQQELNRFVRWYSGERPIAELSAPEVADYAQGLGTNVVDAIKRLEPIKRFLIYAKKKGLTEVNLSPHLKVSSAKRGIKSGPKAKRAAPVPLTSEGYATLEAELAGLKKERPRLVQEIQQAAADKDFRENAPLEAAKEQQGQIEARIRELEVALKSATVLNEGSLDAVEVKIGCTVSLRDLDSEEEMHYTLVSPSETAPGEGKISIVSPIGQALLGRVLGEIVEVIAPAGKLRYRIEEMKKR